MALTFDVELDVRGLVCPLPLLRTKKALFKMAPGQIIKVLVTDPAAELDFKVFAELSGNALLQSAQEGETFIFWLRKKPDAEVAP